MNNAKKRAFNADDDCVIGAARKRHKKEPHRPHHVLCEKNRKTGGGSVATVQSNKFSKYLLEHYSAPMKDARTECKITGGGTPSIAQCFPTAMSKNNKTGDKERVTAVFDRVIANGTI